MRRTTKSTFIVRKRQPRGERRIALYQYFPDKKAIVDALADAYVEAFQKMKTPLTTRKFATLHELASETRPS
jgi:hypothetical protein